MTTRTEFIATRVAGSPRRGPLYRLTGLAGSGVLRVGVIVIALLWLVPVFGLLVSSLRGEADNASSGWWKVFTIPAELTLNNYKDLLGNSTVIHSLLNTVYISVPATVLVIVLSALAAYALAWMRVPGRDWFVVVIVGLLVIPV